MTGPGNRLDWSPIAPLDDGPRPDPKRTERDLASRRGVARCPVTGLACSTAYRRGPCRCDACRRWQSERQRRYNAAHREQERDRQRRWRAANPDSARQYGREKGAANNRDYRRRLRAALVAFLGGACEKCGSHDNLDAHHLNGDGAEHRRRAGGALSSWLEILSGAYPRESIQLLCRGCHNIAHGSREQGLLP